MQITTAAIVVLTTTAQVWLQRWQPQRVHAQVDRSKRPTNNRSLQSRIRVLAFLARPKELR